MPEATEPGQSTQTEQIASTPAAERDQPTTVKTSEKSGPAGDKSLMDLLDIPPEVQQRVAPKAEEGPEEQPELPTEERPEARPSPEEDEEPEELQAGEEEAEEAGDTPAATERVDKRQKRINRLTRKKAELEEQLDRFAAENHQLREKLGQNQGQQRPENQPAPLVGGNLPAIQEQLAAQDAILGWCDRNSDGGELGEGEKAQYIDAQGVKNWRRDAEAKRQELVLDRRLEKARLNTVREQADRDAYALLPEMFDKTKPEYQEAVAILRQYPFMVAIPEANMALAQLLEGRRSISARKSVSSNGQQTKKQHRDIDERVFSTPRVPIAPHTAEPPTRESKPSSQKRYNEAMSRLINDPDGGVENLAAALAAREAAGRQAPSPRSPVRS